MLLAAASTIDMENFFFATLMNRMSAGYEECLAHSGKAVLRKNCGVFHDKIFRMSM